MSIALLSSQVAPETFNSDFYVTAASVIPVLFLAVALQSQFQQDLLKLVFRPMRRELYRKVATTWIQALTYYVTLYSTVFGTFTVGLLILAIAVYGVLGEILAIAVLAAQSTAPVAARLPGLNVEATVRISVEFLTGVVAVTSALVLAKFVRGLLRELRDLWRKRRAANRAAWGDWLVAGLPYAVWRKRRDDARTFPVVWRPDAPDDGGFSDPVVTMRGTVFIYVSPLVDATAQEAYPDIVSGGQVTVTDHSGRKIGAGTLTRNADPVLAAAKLEKSSGGDWPKPTAAELAAPGAVYDFTVTIPWLVRYAITVGRQDAVYFTAAQMGDPLLVFTATPEPSS
jgi:hypothetical protein